MKRRSIARSVTPLMLICLFALGSSFFSIFHQNPIRIVNGEDGTLRLQDILDMKQAGVGDELIINRIHETGTYIDLTVKQIIELKRKGLSDKVIKALLKKPDNLETQETSNPQSSPTISSPVVPIKSDELQQSPTPVTTPNIDPDVSINPYESPVKKIFKITTIPSNAKVYLDDRYVGVTPYYTNLVIGGEHTLVIKKEYYRDLKVEIDLEDESIQDLDLTLRLEQPIIFVLWDTNEVDAVSNFKWSARNCRISGSENLIKLIPQNEQKEYEETYLIDLADLKHLSNDDVACLEFYVWFKSTWAKKELIDILPKPDLHFLVSDIPITYQEPVTLQLELQRHPRYPQGTRIILNSDVGQLYRMKK